MWNTLPTLIVLSILLGLVHLLLAGAMATASCGAKWGLGNRDGDPPPLSLHAARARRAAVNYLETYPFFAAAVVCAIALDRQGSLVVLGAQIYFWARVVYLPVYLIGIPVLRTLVWLVATAGLLTVTFALL